MNAQESYYIWSRHGRLLNPYPLCADGCHDGWPCPPRRDAEARLRAAGIDPFAVYRGEMSLPSTPVPAE